MRTKHRIKKRGAISGGLLFLLFIVAISLAGPAYAQDVILQSVCGTPAIDGVLNPGEWENAASVNFPVNVPGGGTVDGGMYVMNDAFNLYIAIWADHAAEDNSADIAFDMNGIIDPPDDLIGFNPDPAVGFLDQARTIDPDLCPCLPECIICTRPDTMMGGTQDGTGAFSNAGGRTVYEFSHPLHSGDGYDFSLLPGDLIRFNLSIRFVRPPQVWPDDFADTHFPASSPMNSSDYGVIEIASCPLADVEDLLAIAQELRTEETRDYMKRYIADYIRMLGVVPPGVNYPWWPWLLTSGCYDIAVNVINLQQKQIMESVKADLELLSPLFPPEPYNDLTKLGDFINELYTIREAKGTALSIPLNALAQMFQEGVMLDPGDYEGIVKRIVENINQFYQRDAQRILNHEELVRYQGKCKEIEVDMNKINTLTEKIVEAIDEIEIRPPGAEKTPYGGGYVGRMIKALSDSIAGAYKMMDACKWGGC